jgi:hypothetical protein
MYSGRSGRANHLRHRSGQILAHVAADTAIGEIDDVPIVFNSDNEFGVNVDRAKVVHQYSDPKAVIACKNTIQQRRFACAEKAGQDCQRDGLRAGLVGRDHLDSLSESSRMIVMS